MLKKKNGRILTTVISGFVLIGLGCANEASDLQSKHTNYKKSARPQEVEITHKEVKLPITKELGSNKVVEKPIVDKATPRYNNKMNNYPGAHNRNGQFGGKGGYNNPRGQWSGNNAPSNNPWGQATPGAEGYNRPGYGADAAGYEGRPGYGGFTGPGYGGNRGGFTGGAGYGGPAAYDGAAGVGYDGVGGIGFDGAAGGIGYDGGIGEIGFEGGYGSGYPYPPEPTLGIPYGYPDFQNAPYPLPIGFDVPPPVGFPVYGAPLFIDDDHHRHHHRHHHNDDNIPNDDVK